MVYLILCDRVTMIDIHRINIILCKIEICNPSINKTYFGNISVFFGGIYVCSRYARVFLI